MSLRGRSEVSEVLSVHNYISGTNYCHGRNITTDLRPVYSDTTQLNSTSSGVELSSGGSKWGTRGGGGPPPWQISGPPLAPQPINAIVELLYVAIGIWFCTYFEGSDWGIGQWWEWNSNRHVKGTNKGKLSLRRTWCASPRDETIRESDTFTHYFTSGVRPVAEPVSVWAGTWFKGRDTRAVWRM